MHIEKLELTDYDSIYSLWKSLDGIGLSGADSRNSIAGYLERNPGMSFVCRRDGRIVGTILGVEVE